MSALVNQPESPAQAARRLAAAATKRGFSMQVVHEYQDQVGNPLHWRIRAKNHSTGEKWIRPMQRTEQGFVFGEPSYPNGKPLYQLHKLALNLGASVFVVEGEACVDALAKFDVLATTSGGADSVATTDWTILAKRRIVIWPDNDEAGQHYAQAVAAKLQQVDCKVFIVDIKQLDLPQKGDVVDWLQANPMRGCTEVLALSSLPYVAPSITTGKQPNKPAVDEWPAILPIQASLHPVPAFDAATLLPPALRDWVTDEADRMPCPPDFIAAALLVSLGTVIGARCAIEPKSQDCWQIVPNLWGGIVGLPSAKKSPAISAALKPIERLCAQAKEAFQAEQAGFEADNMVHAAIEDAIAARIKTAAKGKGSADTSIDAIAKELQTHREFAPDVPIQRRYKTNDPTVEKLGELLRDNPNGLLVLRDELVGLIASWEKEGHEGERAFYLEAWNGNASFETDRILRGTVFIPNLCVSVFGGIQPDKLTRYLEQASNALANDGMLQRFQILVYPDHCQWQWRDRAPSKTAREHACAIFEVLADFDPLMWGAKPSDDASKFPAFQFCSAAQEIFKEWSYELHVQRLPAVDHPIIAQHLTKFDKLFPALALIFHLVDCASLGQSSLASSKVSAEAALRAAAWCDYLEAHARRCYGLLADDGLRSAQALAEKIKQGKVIDQFTARDIRRNQWRYLISEEAVQAALDWLEDENWLRAYESGGTGPGAGRRTLRYRINPHALPVGATCTE